MKLLAQILHVHVPQTYVALKQNKNTRPLVFICIRLLVLVHNFFGSTLSRTTPRSQGAIYLDAHPPSFSAHVQMSLLAFREHELDAHVPLNGGELIKPQILMVTWGSMFTFFFVYSFGSAGKHSVPFLSNALSSFLPSPCPAMPPWPWVSCASLCELWETKEAKKTKFLSPDWISH